MKIQLNTTQKFVHGFDVLDRLRNNFCVCRAIIIGKYDPTILRGFGNSSFEFGHS